LIIELLSLTAILAYEVTIIYLVIDTIEDITKKKVKQQLKSKTSWKEDEYSY
jgi:hypothetical protein